MNRGSEESSVKSKYQNSSRKIKQLYEEFEHLKQRISTPAKQRKQGLALFYQKNRHNNSTQLKPASVSFTYAESKEYDLGAKNAIDHETRMYLKNTFQKFLTSNISGLDKKIDDNIQTFQQRLFNISKLLTQVTRFMKLKQSNITALNSIKCNCKWKGEQVKQVQSKYKIKIQELRQSYQNKISLLLKDNETSGSSNPKKFPKQIQQQLKALQQKMLLKQEESTQLKIQLTRLRRTCNQKQKLCEQKQSLIGELTKQNHQKIHQNTQIKTSIHKIRKQCEEKLRLQIGKKDSFEENIQKQMDLLVKKNHKLQNQISHLKQTQDKKQDHQLKDHNKSKIHQWNFSVIEDKSVVNSDYEEEQVINTLEIDHHQPLRHSHVVHTNTKKKTFQLQLQIRQLQAQLQLVSEQNRQLKTKKDKFEDQVKQNQSDQERFQQQSQIFREQLKRVNASLRTLDQCAVDLLKANKISQDKVQFLDDSLKFRQAYFKKYPKRANSVRK